MNVYTPHNKVPFLLVQSAGLEMLHGGVIRIRVNGQLPITFIKSEDIGQGEGGKGQGKSGACQGVNYAVGDTKTRICPSISKQEMKKLTSRTTLPQCIEDVKDSGKLNDVCAWQYDTNVVYSTKEGQYRSICEIFGSGNACKLDECHGDRIRIIPFQCWKRGNCEEFGRRRDAFIKVVSRDERPTEFSIGEAGDFFRSEEYMQRRTFWANYLSTLCEVVKIRTLEVGYGGLLATMEWTMRVFGQACPVSEHELKHWIENVWVKQIKRQHVEKGNAVNVITRYLLAVLEMTADMTQTEVKKFLRLTKTTKLKEKFALGLFPDPKLPLDSLDGVDLDTVRQHILSQGGAIDRQMAGQKAAQGLFVKDFIDDDEEVQVEATNKEQCGYKKCLLIPVNLLSDKLVIDFADKTGQQEHYSMYGADAATPSLLSELSDQQGGALNSTSNGSVGRLHLSESTIDAVNTVAVPTDGGFEIVEVAESEIEVVNETRDSADVEDDQTLNSDDTTESTNDTTKSTDDATKSTEEETHGDFNLEEIPLAEVSTRRRQMKAANLHVSINIGEQLYYLCKICKKPHSTTSALTRHLNMGKCKAVKSFNSGVMVKCQSCTKICTSLGGLSRHMNASHRSKVSKPIFFMD